MTGGEKENSCCRYSVSLWKKYVSFKGFTVFFQWNFVFSIQWKKVKAIIKAFILTKKKKYCTSSLFIILQHFLHFYYNNLFLRIGGKKENDKKSIQNRQLFNNYLEQQLLFKIIIIIHTQGVSKLFCLFFSFFFRGRKLAVAYYFQK